MSRSNEDANVDNVQLVATSLASVTQEFSITVDPAVTGPSVDKGVVSDVDNMGWTIVTDLDHTYTNMVVIATPNYDENQVPLVTRSRTPPATASRCAWIAADGSRRHRQRCDRALHGRRGRRLHAWPTTA